MPLIESIRSGINGFLGREEPEEDAPSNIAIERLVRTPKENAEEVGRQMEGLYQLALRARSGREAAWFKRLLAYSGERRLSWDVTSKALRPSPRKPTWALDEHWNEIRPTINHAVAIQTRDNLEFVAAASSTDGADIAKSEAASKAAEHLYRDLKFRKKRIAVRRLAMICGTAAWEPEWDSGGPPYTAGVDETGAPTQLIPMGCHRINILSPFEIVPDPTATGDDDGDYIFTIREVTVSWARSRFPQFADKIQTEDVENYAPDEGMWFLRQYQEFGRRAGGGSLGGMATSTGGESRESLLLKKCYIPSSETLPLGRFIIMVGNTVVWDDVNPIYPDDPSAPRSDRRSPVFAERYIWNGKSYWGDSLTEDIIGPQETRDRLVSKGLAIVYSNQRGIIVKQPGIKVTDEPCPVIDNTAGGNIPPDKVMHMYPAMPFPPGILEFITLAKEQVQSTASIHSPTRGESNPGDSGVLVRELQEQDSSVLGPVKQDNDEVEAEVMKYLLLLVGRWWTVPRAVQTLGPDMETETTMLKSTDFSASTDLWVETDSGLPHNRVSSWMMVTQLLQTKFFELPPPAQQAIARMLKIGGGANFIADAAADEKRARRMISRIEQGEPQQVAFYDNFDVINHVFSTYMKSEKYEALVVEQPQLKMLFEQVLSMALMGKQGQIPPPMPGAPGAPGAPAPGGAAPQMPGQPATPASPPPTPEPQGAPLG